MKNILVYFFKKKINNVNEWIIWICSFIMLPNTMFALSFEEVVDKIDEFTNGTIIKSIATIIVIGIGVYMAKNHDRLKEVAVMCITIIVAIMLVMNAKAVTNFLF